MQKKVDIYIEMLYANIMKYLMILMYSVISIAYADNREKVLILDTGISSKWVDKKYLCEDGEKSMFSSVEDTNGHGSNVYNLITENMDSTRYCIVSLRIFGDDDKCSDKDCLSAFHEALKLVVKDSKIKHLNLSLGGKEKSLDIVVIEKILERGGFVTVAAGNQAKNLDESCDYYPACYKETIKNNNFRVVGNNWTIRSNFGKIVTDTEFAYKVGVPAMTGTSQASAILMSKLLKKR
jgi:hypothetical protein